MIQHDSGISGIEGWLHMQDMTTPAPDKYEIEGEEILEKEVKAFENGGANVYTPRGKEPLSDLCVSRS